jgi:hypothetical protein
MRVGDIVMGGTARALAEVEVVARGAAGDLLVLIDATGLVAKLEIDSDDWLASVPLPAVHTFIRAEIIAGEASRARLISEFTAALDGRELPWQLKGADLLDQPIRRALGNPIYIGA